MLKGLMMDAPLMISDVIVFTDELPHSATGKLRKTALRDQYQDFELPTADTE